MEAPLTFAGNPLNRASAERPGEAWLAERRSSGLFLPFWQMRPLVRDGCAGFQPWQPAWEGAPCIFLGLDGAQPLFALDLGQAEMPPPLDGEFQEMRPAAFILPGRDAAIAGQAKALLDWHSRHGFCPNCGAKTEMRDGGYRRLCPACGAEHFPRTDPVVIMLPIRKTEDGGDECLVGRNQRFTGGLFSAFAGFVEPGESMEEAVRRELREETALQVGTVRYHKSQPWPFPSSLMLGCYAEALTRDFTIDGSEIAEARWISKDEARRRLRNEIVDEMKLPAVIAIAHHLVKDWAENN
ncbi:MAG TPA: NAD(+) diphosphatase [Rhizomicrobium sp.]|nr:NAD(+) diphosphatase [Rhizomicrobium sp.]